MPRPLPQRALARRALETSSHRRNWIRQGAAVLGVSVLSLGVAGSVAITGNAQHLGAGSADQLSSSPSTTPSVSTSVAPGVAAPTAFDRREQAVSRSNFRPSLASAAVDRRADRRAGVLTAAGEQAQQAAQGKAVQKREKSLDQAAKAARTKAKELKAEAAEEKRRAEAKREKAERAKRKKAAEAERERANRASMPVTSGYRIAARFGDTGSWSRYHTGIDFSAPMGTTIRAAAAGVVTHAGSGSESWAGTYVTIKHSDGKSTLYAHMSTVSVNVGERVSGGDRVGAIGMTGRTFGPHVHVELYPAGVKPGDPYEAINPAPWLRDHGLNL